MKEPPDDKNETLKEILNKLTPGLVYVHTRLDDNTYKSVRNEAKLAALIEILVEKGIIEPEKIEERGKRILLDLIKTFAASAFGVEFLDSKYDAHEPKDDVIIECSGRVSACKAVCCRLPFALTRKEVETGIIHWEFARPYLIAKNADGYCAHFDRDKFTCTIHENRPVSCRLFDCRTDKRWPVWRDFEKNTANPILLNRLFYNGESRK
jgi:Fe-S-cluster containining protein